LQDRSRKDEAGKTPFLGSIPLIGWLFQDKKFEDKDREVMITVNPTIVRDRLSQAMLWSFPGTRELLRREPPPQPPAEEPAPPSPEGHPVPASGTQKPAGQ
jgi:type II secretory pathway component GspD/PulD (secretin)